MSDFIVDTIFPCGEIHLVAGPTGAGKTRWLFDTLLDWQTGKDVLGYKSYPAPWVYLSCDRSAKSVNRTLETMGIDTKDIPLVAAMDRKMSMSQVLDAAAEYKAKLVVVESFGSFVEVPTTGSVKRFFYGLRSFLNETGAAIIGVVESPKMKPRERYENPRQRISGVATWGHYAETIVLIEPIVSDSKSSPRRITVCPRNAPEIYLRASFEHGRLVVTGEYKEAESDMPVFT